MKKLMESFRRVGNRVLAAAAALLICVSALCFAMVPAHAAYTYTVRIYTGNQGTVNQTVAATYLANLASAGATITYGTDEIKITGIPAVNPADGNAYRVTFSETMVNITNDKYLIRGIRESGRDNNTAVASVGVTKDLDLVVAYYIKNGAVQYTVHYVDENAAEIAASETHYGNAGDSLALAFHYVEGYIPAAYNGRITLADDPADNVFYFPYEKFVPAEATAETTENKPNAEPPVEEADPAPADDAEGADIVISGNAGDDRASVKKSGSSIPEVIDIPNSKGQIAAKKISAANVNNEKNDSSKLKSVVGHPAFIIGAIGGTSVIALTTVLLVLRKRRLAK